MLFTIVTIGKLKIPFIIDGVHEYQRRINRYAQISFLFIKEEKIYGGGNEAQVLEREGKRILARLPHDGIWIALDRKGWEWSSEEHFSFLEDQANRGVKKIYYIIGGPLGLAEEILSKADHVLSLSRMTLPHEMATLFIVEQIYRYLNHKAGEKYHK